jgi:Domain of unknown function (DUF4292)
MKQFLALILLLFMLSCKTKQVVTQPPKTTVNEITAKTIIDNHYNNKIDFSALSISSDVSYADERQSQNVTAEIKIKKDREILVIIRFLGITMAKAYITPKTVSYYEKIKGTYFEGNFSSLSQWLGTDLDFNKIQNMLIGEAIYNLKDGKYKESLEEQVYKLEDVSANNLKKTFFLDATKFLITKQEITQVAEDRMIQIAYSESKEYNQGTMPTKVVINAFQSKGKAEIGLEYNKVTFNEEFSLPYTVPNGYKKIIIK